MATPLQQTTMTHTTTQSAVSDAS